MLTKRIIACLDVRGGRVVKGVQFVDIVDAGDPAELAHRHAAAGADEIVLLDITATHEGRGTLLDTVKRTAAELFVPFTVGGGIRSAEDAAAVFDAGADKVSINSAAIARPELIGEIGGSFGAQAVIVAIDARRSTGANPVQDAEVYVSGGRKPTGRKVVEWAREAEQRGAGEILLTSMDTDGMRNGFDCELTRDGEWGGADSGDRFRRRGQRGAFCGGVWTWQGGCCVGGEYLSFRRDGFAGVEGRVAAGWRQRPSALLDLKQLQKESWRC